MIEAHGRSLRTAHREWRAPHPRTLALRRRPLASRHDRGDRCRIAKTTHGAHPAAHPMATAPIPRRATAVPCRGATAAHRRSTPAPHEVLTRRRPEDPGSRAPRPTGTVDSTRIIVGDLERGHQPTHGRNPLKERMASVSTSAIQVARRAGHRADGCIHLCHTPTRTPPHRDPHALCPVPIPIGRPISPWRGHRGDHRLIASALRSLNANEGRRAGSRMTAAACAIR